MKNIILTSLFLSVLCLTSCLSDDDIPKALPFEEQLEIDVQIIDEYLSDNNIQASQHESEIRFVTSQVGGGASPTQNSTVNVKYKGQLLNGTVFDENTEGVSFPLNRLIGAWQIMIPEMKEGGKMTIYAPSVYCYGFSGQGSIPRNANLIFDIELISIQ